MWQNREPMPMSRCMNCKHACGETACSWAEEFKPVEGWIAEPTVISANQSFKQDSYLVLYCPLFERGHSKVEWDDGDIRMLVIEMLFQAVEDWIALDYGRIEEKKYRSELIKSTDLIMFFNSRYFNYLVKHTLDYKPRTIRKALGVPELERGEVRWR